jgi:hypothetical protein
MQNRVSKSVSIVCALALIISSCSQQIKSSSPYVFANSQNQKVFGFVDMHKTGTSSVNIQLLECQNETEYSRVSNDPREILNSSCVNILFNKRVLTYSELMEVYNYIIYDIRNADQGATILGAFAGASASVVVAGLIAAVACGSVTGGLCLLIPVLAAGGVGAAGGAVVSSQLTEGDPKLNSILSEIASQSRSKKVLSNKDYVVLKNDIIGTVEMALMK